MFTPETVDEQIEDMLRDLRTQHRQQRQAPALDMARDLSRAYQSSEEAETRALEHGWQRLRQAQRDSRLLDQQREGLGSPGSLSFPPVGVQYIGRAVSVPVRPRTLQYRLGIVAILAMLVLLTGSLAMLLNAIRQPQPQPLAPVLSQSGVYIVDFDVVYKLDIKTGAERWHHRLDSDGQKLYMVGGNLYVGTRTGIEALNTTNGTLRWQRTMQGSGRLWVSDGFIYVEDGAQNVQTGYENLYRLNPSNGTPLWSHAHMSAFMVGAAHGLVYLKSTRNVLSALDATSGQLRWQKQETGTFNWQNELFSIVLVGNTIYDDSANTLYALNALDGSIRWQKLGKQGQMMGILTATDDAIYVTMSTPYTPSNPDASTNPYISAYSAQTGAPLWTSDKGDILYFDVKPTGGVVFVNARHSHTVSINALNSQNGKVHWSYNTGHCSAVNTCPETSGPLTAADGILYILHTTDTNHEELLALDVTTGATRWSRPVKYGFSDFSPTVSNGMLYLAEQLPNTLSGNILHTYRVTDGSERWTRQFGLRPMGGDRLSSNAMVIVP